MAGAAFLTQNARALITNYWLNNASTAAQPTVITWGTNPKNTTGSGAPNAAATDIGMFTEGVETRIGGASVTVTQQTIATNNDTIQFVGTMTCASVAGENICEVGVFDSITVPYNSTILTGSGIIGSSSSTSASVASAYTPTNNTYCELASGEVVEVTAGHNIQTLTLVRGALTSTANASTLAGDYITVGSPPGGTAVTGGSMFMHANFQSIGLNQGDSIKFTIQVRFE